MTEQTTCIDIDAIMLEQEQRAAALNMADMCSRFAHQAQDRAERWAAGPSAAAFASIIDQYRRLAQDYLLMEQRYRKLAAGHAVVTA